MTQSPFSCLSGTHSRDCGRNCIQWSFLCKFHSFFNQMENKIALCKSHLERDGKESWIPASAFFIIIHLDPSSGPGTWSPPLGNSRHSGVKVSLSSTRQGLHWKPLMPPWIPRDGALKRFPICLAPAVASAGISSYYYYRESMGNLERGQQSASYR